MTSSHNTLTTNLNRAIRLLLAPVIVIVSAGCSVFGIESVENAQYRVIQKDEQFEVREYEPMVVAQTRVNANFKKAGNNAFRRLFSYISGNNAASESIAMTAPVVAEENTDGSGEKIAMTAPVTANRDGEAWLYRFVLPASYTLADAPRPLDPEIELAEIPAMQVATIRFAGRSTEKARSKNTQALIEWMDSAGLAAASDPRWAGYNAPWALPPFRRNEVLIDIAK